jgi:hypothetical protein
MPSYQTRCGSFQQILRTFLQDDGDRFREVLTDAQIERTAEQHNLCFGTGANNIYTVPLTLWAFVTQAVSESKSCRAAVARLLAWLTKLGLAVCSAGTGAYCKARAKLTEVFVRALACDVGRQLEDQAVAGWRWRGRRTVLIDGSTLSMPDTEANQSEYPQSRS